MTDRPPAVLAASSGAPRVDAFLQRFVAAVEAALPGHVRGYYLIGSYADGSAVAVSDLDLVVLLRGHLEATDAAAAVIWRLGEVLASACPARLDLTVSGEDDPTWEKKHVKLAGRLVAGEDVRNQIILRPPTPPDVWEGMRYAQFHIVQELRGVTRVTLPLTYPDPDGEFFGYDTNRHARWYPPGTTQGLRMLVNTACTIALACLPAVAGRQAATKAQTISLYREHGGGAWASYLEMLYAQAKRRWGYLVPHASAERQRLRALCQEMLGLEHHFLEAYRELLLRLLRADDGAGRRFAVARLEEVVYRDAALQIALRDATASVSAPEKRVEGASHQDALRCG